MESNIEKLLDMKKKVEQAEQEEQELKSKEKFIMEQIKNDFGITTVIAAKKKLKSMKNKMESMEKEIRDTVFQLEEDYQWD